MNKVLLFFSLTFFTTKLFSQVLYRVEYDKPSDKFTYKKIEYSANGEKKEVNLKGKLPKLNNGDNVVIEVTNYNPFLYHVEIEGEEMKVSIGKKSNAFGFLSMFTGGLAPLSLFMTGLSDIQSEFSKKRGASGESIAKNVHELEIFDSESKLVVGLINDYEKRYSLYHKTLTEIEKEDLQSNVKTVIVKLKEIYKNYYDPTDKIELLSASSRLHFFKAGVSDSKLIENANSFDYQLTKFKELLADPDNSYTKLGIQEWINKLESAEFKINKSFMVSSEFNSFIIGSSEEDKKQDALVGMNYKIKFYRLKDIKEALNPGDSEYGLKSPVYLKYYYPNKYWKEDGELVDTLYENCTPVLIAEGLWKNKEEIPRNYSELFESEEDMKDKKMKDDAIGKWIFYSDQGNISSVSYGPKIELGSKNKVSQKMEYDLNKISSMYSVVKSVEIPVKGGIIMNWASGLYSISSFKQRFNYFTTTISSGDSLSVQEGTLSRAKICIGSQMASDFRGNKLITPTLNFGAAVDFWDERDIHFLVGGGLKFKKFPFLSLTAGIAFTQINVLDKSLQVGQTYDNSYPAIEEPSEIQAKKYVPGYFMGLNINF